MPDLVGAALLFLLGWVIPFWAIIEMTPTKLPHYMLPVMPGLAMLAALGARAVLAPARPARPARNRRPAETNGWSEQ